MFIAEREGFEPPEPFSSTVFKTAVIDHSTTSPNPFGTANVNNIFNIAIKYLPNVVLSCRQALCFLKFVPIVCSLCPIPFLKMLWYAFRSVICML